MRQWRKAAILTLLVLVIPAHGVAATLPTQNKGLLITPLRSYIHQDAGQTKTSTITIGNLSDKTIQVALQVDQFSVANYTYDYQFRLPEHDWIKLGVTQIELEAHKSRKITYQVAIPPGTPPGGNYFTILATTSLNQGSIPTKVQAATILYLTVSGSADRSSVVRKSHFPLVAFSQEIPFTLDAKNTGNTHFFIYAFGSLKGITSRQSPSAAAHLLLPGTTRTVGGTVPAPVLPGIYKAYFGYKTDFGQTMQQSRFMLYLPPWSFSIPFGLLWVGLALRKRRNVATRQNK